MSSAINSQIWNAKAANVQNNDGSPFYVTGTWVPTWTAAGGGAALGTSVITGKYTKIGNLVTATIRVVFAGASFGTGNYYFSLPFAPVGLAYGSGMVTDQGVGYYSLVAAIGIPSAGALGAIVTGGLNLLSATAPCTFVNTDVIDLTVTYYV